MRIAFLEQFKKNNHYKNIFKNRKTDTKDTRKLLKKIK